MNQCVGLRDIVDVGRRDRHAVNQPGIGIHTSMGFHAEMPLVVFLRLVHLRVAFTTAVLGGAGRGDQGGIDNRVALQQQAFGGQRSVDGGQDLKTQVVLFEQVAKPKDGALVGQVVFTRLQPRKLRNMGVSYSASSIAGSERLNHC